MFKKYCLIAVCAGCLVLDVAAAFADCSDAPIYCKTLWRRGGNDYVFTNLNDNKAGEFSTGRCWSWSSFSCDTCGSSPQATRANWANRCAALFPRCAQFDGCAACATWMNQDCFNTSGNKVNKILYPPPPGM